MPQRLVAIARDAIHAHLSDRIFRPPTLSSPWDESRGVFVTLRGPGDALRGCIGHLAPTRRWLTEEVASCAVAAATEDPRFPVVRLRELDTLRIELSLMAPPEPVADTSTLDPARYGVIVRSGKRMGVLLPGIPEVETVAMQLAICRRKAGIHPDDACTVERFTVHRVVEPPRGET